MRLTEMLRMQQGDIKSIKQGRKEISGSDFLNHFEATEKEKVEKVLLGVFLQLRFC